LDLISSEVVAISMRFAHYDSSSYRLRRGRRHIFSFFLAGTLDQDLETSLYLLDVVTIIIEKALKGF
jgi:hypothetical protein